MKKIINQFEAWREKMKEYDVPEHIIDAATFMCDHLMTAAKIAETVFGTETIEKQPEMVLRVYDKLLDEIERRAEPNSERKTLPGSQYRAS